MTDSIHSNRRGFLKSAGLASAMAAAAGWAPQTRAADAADDASGKQPPFQLGLASYTTRKFTLEETVAMCQRLELKYLCLKSFHLPLDATDEQIVAARKLVQDAGLELYAGGVISMKNPDDVENAFRYARAAGMLRIVGVPAPEVLPLVDQKVKQYDIEVAIHNHGPGDKVYPTPESAYEKVKDLDKRIGLCMDIGHTLRIGADPVADAKRFADRLLDVHIKDVTAAAREGSTLEIGRGVIDIPAFLQTLIDIGYSRIAAFEYEKDADDPLPGLAESVGYVRGVLATL
jgi:sugar phosphate isomerase/epimerase